MISFLICLTLLVGAYFTYGRYLEKLADIDEKRKTPVDRMENGVALALTNFRVGVYS